MTGSRALLILLGACGRLGFSEMPTGDGDGDAGPLDGDAATPITVTLGETGATTFSGVTTDTMLEAVTGGQNKNYGARPSFDIVGEDVGLLRFDLVALPPGTHVVSASLRITTVGNTSNSTVRVYRVRERWEEGAQTGTAGTANFNERMAGVPWSTPGATGTSRDTAAVAAFLPNMPGAHNITLPAMMVESWISNPATNCGLVFDIDSVNDAADFFTREAADPTVRPVLRITYVP